jgi:hypothetical protein
MLTDYPPSKKTKRNTVPKEALKFRFDEIGFGISWFINAGTKF